MHQTYLHQIHFIKMFILLITMIGIINVAGGVNNKVEKLNEPLIVKEKNFDQFQCEVIEDGTTEEEDMEKAVALSKTPYWGLMMGSWRCEISKLNPMPKVIGFKSDDELLEFCGQWKIITIAANAYVKSWEKNRKGQKLVDEVGTSSSRAQKTRKMKQKENPLECHFVKPILQIEKRELQMSSAMEAIKSVYRDLFLWGEGNTIKSLKTKVHFSNKEEVYFSGCLSEKVDCLNLNENTEELYREKLVETYKQFKLFFHVDPFKTLKNLFTKNDIEEWRKDFNIFLKMWKLAEEIGLDFAHICDAGKNYKNGYIDGNLIQKGWYNWKNNQKMEDKLIVRLILNQYPYWMEEQLLGIVFIDYKEEYDKIQKKKDAELNEISAQAQQTKNAEMMKKLEKLLLKDPCEQAKLKWKMY